MPVCRHCNSRISKFDKDRCPICGEINPLEGVNSDTVEITSQIELDTNEFAQYKPKRRKTFFLLSGLIGWLGVQFFYLKLYKMAFLWLGVNLVLLGGGFSLIYFGAGNLLLGILLPLLVAYALNISLGAFIYRNPSYKDGNGLLLK